MNELSNTIDTQVLNPSEVVKEVSVGFIQPELLLTILTWAVFLSLIFILKKFAWGPILQNLEKREKEIRDATAYADQIKEEMKQIEVKRKTILLEADQRSKALVEQARKGAVEAASIIEGKAKEEAKILLENAQREIQAEVEKARAYLKEESASVAVKLAERILKENLDDEKNRKLISQIIKEV